MTSLESEVGAPDDSSVQQLPPLTLADELARLAPGWDLDELCRWPPDAFVLVDFTTRAVAGWPQVWVLAATRIAARGE